MGEESEAFYIEKGMERPSNVIPWENNGTQFNEEEYPQPPRPYVALDFADIPLDLKEGIKEGFTEMTVIVVVDNFHQGRDNSDDLTDYLTVLEYGECIEELLDNYEGMETVGFRKPVFSGNLLMMPIRIRYQVRRQRSRLAWVGG